MTIKEKIARIIIDSYSPVQATDEIIQLFNEFVYEEIYDNHNPDKDCACEKCLVCRKLLDKYKK